MDLLWSTLIVLAAALGLWIAVAFNRMVRSRNLLREGFSGIDVQLKRRHDLIPKLLDAVRTYSAHEKATFEHLAELRNLSRSTEQLSRRQDGENSLTDGLKRLFALAEAYPQLKADRNFLDLQQQLTEVEDSLQMARRYYNGAVRDYNIQVESFPSNFVAGLFGFGREEFFQIVTTSEHHAPVVETE
ncbi:MAG: LemA family protein [Planctomycetota bacterium]|nr:LemA family protein [Planctomycetota bacterium]